MTTRQLALMLAASIVSAWVWHRTGGDTLLAGLAGPIAATAIGRYVTY